jgi:hypothetical protein
MPPWQSLERLSVTETTSPPTLQTSCRVGPRTVHFRMEQQLGVCARVALQVPRALDSTRVAVVALGGVLYSASVSEAAPSNLTLRTAASAPFVSLSFPMQPIDAGVWFEGDGVTTNGLQRIIAPTPNRLQFEQVSLSNGWCHSKCGTMVSRRVWVPVPARCLPYRVVCESEAQLLAAPSISPTRAVMNWFSPQPAPCCWSLSPVPAKASGGSSRSIGANRCQSSLKARCMPLAMTYTSSTKLVTATEFDCLARKRGRPMPLRVYSFVHSSSCCDASA